MTVTKALGTYGNAVGVVTPADHKAAQSGLILKTTGNAIRPGLFWGGSGNIITGKANMSYDVSAFTAALSRGSTSGTVLLTNDGTLNVATTAAPGSNSRIDIIYVWAREYSLDGVNSDPVIAVAQGTAAAVPTAPSLAAFPGAIELGRATVTAGITATTSATITQTAPFTALDGGRIPCRNSTEVLALGSSYAQGTQAIDKSTDIVWEYYALYNGSTNPSGAKTAGWYPAPGSDIKIRVGGSGTQQAVGTATIQAAAFSATPTGAFNSSFFTWNNSNGQMKVLVEGRYRVKARVQYSNSAGVSQTYLTKNSTSLSTADALALQDFLVNTSASHTAILDAEDVALLTTDTLRVIAQNPGGGSTNFNQADAAMLFFLEWVGVIHA